MTKANLGLLLLLLFGKLNSAVFAQSNSVLASGTWVKLAITADAVYKISYADLQTYGLDPAVIMPNGIRIFSNDPGMLPQANDAPRSTDLQEVAIYVSGGADNSFDPQDYLLFYGNGPDFIGYDSSRQAFHYEQHLYTDTSFYYLNVGQAIGKRINTATMVSEGSVHDAAFTVYIHEVDQFNLLHSGRFWFGEKFDLETHQTFNSNIENISSGSEIKFISSVMASSLQNSIFRISFNGVEIGTQELEPIPEGIYTTKGKVAQDTMLVNKSMINDEPLTISYKFEKESGLGYLDYFIIQTKTLLLYKDAPLKFYVGDLANMGNISFSVDNCPNNLQLWDISNIYQIEAIPYSQTGTQILFNTASTSTEYVVFDPESPLPTPLSGSIIKNQNLHNPSTTDLLIVAPDYLKEIAEEIAALRQVDGFTVNVVSPDEIYNEYSAGKTDITAIRDYVKYLYDNAGLKFLLLFGKGTYDPKNIIGSSLCKIPIYESRNSLQPLATYGSDDYLGFLEDEEGEWQESQAGDHTMDIGVGRIPVTTEEEANNYLAKLKTYQSKSSLGAWRKEVVFVAEDGDFNLHQRDADRLATLIDTTYASFNTNKIYVDNYPIEVNPGSKRAPEANQEIYDAINKGALVVNYTGHGNENQWANTKIFDRNVIDTLRNITDLSLFVTATCEFGRHDDTGERSGGEELIVKHKTGAIATITTARPVFSSSNYQLNVAFYNEVFSKAGNEYQRLGDIFRTTKNNSLNGVLNRNFSFLGDPSLRLNYPALSISLDSLNGSLIMPKDTLTPLEELHFTGAIRNSNNLIAADFSGAMDIIIFDKPSSKKTLGNTGNVPFSYLERDNILFKGRVSVLNGLYSFNTILPKDISYYPEASRITMYAQNENSDAGGANIDLLIGSTASNPIQDLTPPEIHLYLGDTTYLAGKIVSPNTLLIARINDANGINTSLNQVGHSITYKLDNQEPIILNEFYAAELDNFQRGWIYYNLPKLSVGSHTILFTAWDTSNNMASSSLEFVVAEEGEIIISDLSNYPNPMSNLTNFTFSHNLSGEDLEVTLNILSTSGQNMFEETRSYLAAPSVINDWQWDGRNSSGGKLNAGIYLFGIKIRSTITNLTEIQYSRLFITN